MSVAKSLLRSCALLAAVVAAGCSSDATDAPPADTSGAGDTVAADTVVPLGATGDPCARAADCASGLCTPTAAGSVCTEACTDSCPTGYACLPAPSGDGKLCWDLTAIACQPCTTDAQCQLGGAGNACVSYGAAGSFCGLACAGAGDCPSGYDCNGDGQCVAASG
ncbi:MAG: hypothetical protein KC635_04315, partial [Myxococcales bacterium]|nr:hypothetical protein [Myxococcales bacterium]